MNADDLLLYSLEITVRAVTGSRSPQPIEGKPSKRTAEMGAIYADALEAARLKMREGELTSAVHRACAEIFEKHGFGLGHLSGHSIGLTMIEYPAIGANTHVERRENIIFSLHPQVLDSDGQVCCRDIMVVVEGKSAICLNDLSEWLGVVQRQSHAVGGR